MATHEEWNTEQKYQDLFINHPMPMWIYDYESRAFLEVNEEAIRHYGYSREEFLSMTINDIRPKEDIPKIHNLGRVETQYSSIYTGAWRHYRKNGELMYVEITSHLMQYNGRKASLVLVHNITDVIKAEERLKQAEEQKRYEITEAVITAQEKERQEIGRELHDNINQILATARLYLDVAKEEQNEDPSFVIKADEFIATAITEIRNLSHALIAPTLGKTKLTEAIALILDTMSKTGGFAAHKKFTVPDENVIQDKLKLSIYRIVQEQLNNIQKYAKAKNVFVELLQEDGKLKLSMRDDGIGFDKSKKSGGIGLMNMRTRASLFKGRMKILASEGNGCELKVTFPLA